ncbi:hypothetical protein MAMC_00799 [Methylacidimicrobium cyclopophantes]|uniref:Uncharacterized protein n=1 Tax=Methylacidimicrobium cyclopophantes TaxID=1041766 RepID=A0A5E6MDC3_9BACT|nr:NfeD family protein [Methylacidimicrobium cyclopophantes]VVM05812.1 hypothetical protein MAMC_00799 [Methylacidimicrobium cyclopophantes]
MTAILFFLLVGLLLFAGELLFPSTILGVLAGFAFFAGVVAAFLLFGQEAGFFALAASLLLFGGLLWAWLRFLPRSRLGHRMALEFSNPPGRAEPDVGLIGRQGVLLSPCHPVGVALFEKKRTEVIAESGFLEEGTKIRVIGSRDGRWIVEAVNENCT